MNPHESELDCERRLREQYAAARAAGDTHSALLIARKIEKTAREIDKLGSGNHTEDYGRKMWRTPMEISCSPQMDDFSEDSEP